MQALNVVLLQSNPTISQSLAGILGRSFDRVCTAQSLSDLRADIVKYRAVVAVVDMELVSLSEVGLLTRDFPGTCIICTHRLADEEMWTAALTAGAVDVCPSNDTHGILTAAERIAFTGHAAAA